jgi:hypothetical protein
MEQTQDNARAAVKAVPATPATPKVTAAPAGMAGAARIPQGGAGASMKQQSIFGGDGGSMMGNQVPMAGQSQPKPQAQAQPEPQPEPQHATMGDAGNRREIVFAQPSMGQTSPAPAAAPAPSPALEPYPQIDKVLQTQSVGVSLSRVEVTAILDSLTTTLSRISAPENSASPCVKNLGPGAVEKATTLKNKMTVYSASNPTGPFTDFTADELAGADKILACASELAPPGASSTGKILGWALVAAAAAGVYLLIENTGTRKGKK